jgi:hypothetical protein
MDMSRQNLRKLMVANPSSFPVQVHDSSAGVWHLADLLAWLQQKDYPVDTRVVAVSQTTRQINVLKKLHNLPTGIEPALRALVV